MKKKNNFVSVIVNCYNGEKFLKNCINSILKQTHKNLEIIFFDNFSSDKSFKIIKSYKDRRIKYYSTKKKLNLYNARNMAIKKAKGKYIAFLDTDDWWNKNKLRYQINFLKKNNNIKIVFTNLYLYFQNTGKYKKCYGRLPYGSITQKLLNKYSIGISTVLLEKEIFKKFIFKKKYNIIGDFDFFIKLSKLYNIGSIQKPLVFYRIHESNFSNKKIDLYYKELKNWVNSNEKKFLRQEFELKNIKILLLKLKLKAVLKYFKSILK